MTKTPPPCTSMAGVFVDGLLGWFGDDDETLAEFVWPRSRPAGNQGELLVLCWFEELQVGNLFFRSRTFCRDEFLRGHRVRVFDVPFEERDCFTRQQFVEVGKQLPIPGDV